MDARRAVGHVAVERWQAHTVNPSKRAETIFEESLRRFQTIFGFGA
jgi:hypothetical protein